jgi:hypothetical protein
MYNMTKYRLPRKIKKLYIRSGMTAHYCKWFATNKFAGMDVIQMIDKYFDEQSK